MNDKLLVTVAPCIPPYHAAKLSGLDLSPQGVADEVVRAAEAGANIVHLHVWDHKGEPSVELDAFNQTLELIRARCDIIIEGSTGGMNTLTVDERCVSLDADIELASLNPGSVNYAEGVYINSPQDVNYWTEKMYKRSVKPDMAIFETGMIATCERLAAHGLIASPMLFTFVMGLVGAIPAGPKNLLFLSETVPPGSLWAIAGYNGADLPMSALAMNMGGHVRAGFEDNAFYRPGERATSNAQLIERLVRMAREIGREPATPDEAREMLAVKTA